MRRFIEDEANDAWLFLTSRKDQAITEIMLAIRELMVPPAPTKKRKIGFVQDE